MSSGSRATRKSPKSCANIRRLGSQAQTSAPLDEALAALAVEATPPDLKAI
jgi:threonyl-tRNA synthetase